MNYEKILEAVFEGDPQKVELVKWKEIEDGVLLCPQHIRSIRRANLEIDDEEEDDEFAPKRRMLLWD